MLILNIESSSRFCSVSLARHGQELAFEINSEDFSHGTDINILIQKVLAQANLRMDQLEAVSVNRGPGSYTSLRIGMATAKGLCYGLDLPLFTPDAMQILVDWARRKYPSYEYYVPMIDARRMEVYTISPVKDIASDFEYKAKILDEHSFLDWKDARVCFLGDGVAKWKEIVPASDNWKMVSEEIDARKMIELSQSFSEGNKISDLFHIAPMYIKKPNITRSKKQYF